MLNKRHSSSRDGFTYAVGISDVIIYRNDMMTASIAFPSSRYDREIKQGVAECVVKILSDAFGRSKDEPLSDSNFEDGDDSQDDDDLWDEMLCDGFGFDDEV